MKKLFFLICTILFLINSVYSQEDFKIDWIKGKIYSSASGTVKNDHNFALNRIEAMELIHEKAKANFVKGLKNININESDSVFDYFANRSDKNRDLYSFIDKGILFKVEYPNLNSIKVTYTIDIFGDNSLMNILMDERGKYTEDLIGYMDYHYNTKYTGVIIDARGELISFDGYNVKVKPSLFVTVKDSDGRIIFDRDNVYPEVIRKKGMVKYSYDIKEDYTDRIGKAPLKIAAAGTGDRDGSIIVVSSSSAKKLLSSEITRKAIQEGNIVIVIDR